MTDRRPIDLIVICDDPRLPERAKAVFERWGIRSEFEGDQSRALAKIYESPPDVIVLDRDTAPIDGFVFGHMLKSDRALAHIPIILRVGRDGIADVAGSGEIDVDDFVLDWKDLEVLALRARLCAENSARELDANPLSRLGGNNTIIRGLEDRLARGAEFAVAYADLDNFKAYNDCYGFLRGDEVIRMTARVITTVVDGAGLAGDSLIGHVGGDDFVFIVPTTVIQGVCENLVRSFDLTIQSFYDDEELRRGGIQAVDRRGEPEFFGFVSISIAAVISYPGEIQHPGEFSTITGDLKKRAKTKSGSSIVIDRSHRNELVNS